MRLATVFDKDNNEPRAVFELPGGHRVDLRELFRPEDEVGEELHEMPLYFTDLAKTVEFLDDVTDAVRQWARERAEQEAPPHDDAEANVDLMSFLPPVPIIRNLREFDAFEQHASIWRTRHGLVLQAGWHTAPSFSFANAGSLVGHENAIFAPADCEELDYGLQLGLVIGRGGRDIRVENAWRHVAGLTIVNSFAARDIERRELASGLVRAKSRDFATAVGPYLVSTDSLRDRIDTDDRIHLMMRALVNGSPASRSDAAAMYFTWPQLIEQASRDAELFPGDLLTSGVAPSGSILDRNSHHWLRPGDVVEIEIERLGILRTPIIERPGSAETILVDAVSRMATTPV